MAEGTKPHAPAIIPGLETFPRLLRHHARVRADRPAIREKEYGIWQTYTWGECYAQVRALACGLAEAGFRRGDRLAIVGDNRPRLYLAVAAAQCLGGIPVLLYQDAIAEEMAYVLQDAEVKMAVVEDQEQVDKLLEILDRLPSLERIFYDDPRGMRHYTQPLLQGLDELLEAGRIHDRNQPDFVDEEIEKGESDDVSVMLYTSGTTGKPKGVCQTHSAFIASAQGGVEVDRLVPTDNIISYLPPAGVGAVPFGAQRHQLLGADEAGLLVVAQATWVVVNDVGDAGHRLAHLQQLVHLLLVLGEEELHLRVLDHEGHFGGHRVLVQRNGHATHALHSHHAHVQVRAVVADQGQVLPASEAQGQQAAGQLLHRLCSVFPGPGLPDTVLFFAYGRVCRALGCMFEQQLRERGLHSGSYRWVCSSPCGAASPEVASGTW